MVTDRPVPRMRETAEYIHRAGLSHAEGQVVTHVAEGNIRGAAWWCGFLLGQATSQGASAGIHHGGTEVEEKAGPANSRGKGQGKMAGQSLERPTHLGKTRVCGVCGREKGATGFPKGSDTCFKCVKAGRAAEDTPRARRGDPGLRLVRCTSCGKCVPAGKVAEGVCGRCREHCTTEAQRPRGGKAR